jgi:hypothetical protein
MRRREIITSLGGAATASTAWPWSPGAQGRSKLPEVGILDPGIPQMFDAFRHGMRDLGYEEGRNMSYAYRSA